MWARNAVSSLLSLEGLIIEMPERLQSIGNDGPFDPPSRKS